MIYTLRSRPASGLRFLASAIRDPLARDAVRVTFQSDPAEALRAVRSAFRNCADTHPQLCLEAAIGLSRVVEDLRIRFLRTDGFGDFQVDVEVNFREGDPTAAPEVYV